MDTDMTSSSANNASLLVAMMHTKSTMILTLQTDVQHLEEEAANLTVQQAEGKKRRKADREEFKKLKRWIAVNEQKWHSAEVAATIKKAVAVAEDDSESGEDVKISEAERLAIEANTTAVASNVMKVSWTIKFLKS